MNEFGHERAGRQIDIASPSQGPELVLVATGDGVEARVTLGLGQDAGGCHGRVDRLSPVVRFEVCEFCRQARRPVLVG